MESIWTGDFPNSLEFVEQITYLLSLRRLDEMQEVEELKATLDGPWVTA
jgi:type I restriction enzyme M protein